TPGEPLALRVPIGAWDLQAHDDDDLVVGFSPAQVAVPGARARWLLQVSDVDPCAGPAALDGAQRTLDRDGDGLRSIPEARLPECVASCAGGSGTAGGGATCVLDGEAFDCDDDGDDVPDPLEPGCLGVCAGDDADRDGVCSRADENVCCAGRCPASA